LLNLSGHYNFILILFLTSSLNAGNFENFQSTRINTQLVSNTQSKTDFLTQLTTNWISSRVVKSESLYEMSKPKLLSTISSRRDKPKGPRIGFDIAELEDNNISKNGLDKITKIKKEKDSYIDFFGEELSFNIPVSLKDANYEPKNQKGIVNFISVASSSDYEQLTDYIVSISDRLKLNDWGIYLLVNSISKEIFSNKDEINLLNSLILNKLKYDVRVGISNKRVYLFFNLLGKVYDALSCEIDGKIYYYFGENKNITNISTYLANSTDSNKLFDLSLKVLPKFKKDIKTKELTFKEYGKRYTIKYRYNQNLLDFMATYPQANEEVFLNTPIDNISLRDIAFEMKHYLNSVQASETINFMLHFVQDSFKYELDSVQFKKQKMMFAQETLYYDKSDSEDRVTLFSRLIKELLNINTLGVKYKNHFVSAIQIPTNGNSIKYNGKKYIIVDPSYSSANIGKSIPKYRLKKPKKIIVLTKD